MDGPTPSTTTMRSSRIPRPSVRAIDVLDRVSAPTARHELRLWQVAVLALVADTALTFYGLWAGHAEGNPVMRSVIASQGLVGFLAIKTAALALAVACRPLVERSYRPLLPAAVATPWLAAAAINLAVISLR